MFGHKSGRTAPFQEVTVHVKPLNVAIVGCGYIGARHAASLARLPGVTVAAVVDRDEERAKVLQDEFDFAGAVVTSDVERALQHSDIHAVVIATHHDSHAGLATAAASAGKHIFVEKPLALTIDDCRAIETAVRESGVQCVVGFQTRHAPLVRRARAWVSNPRVLFGHLIAARWDDISWAQAATTGGGNVLSQGVHCVDLLTHTAGAPPRVVFAEGGTITHDPAATDVIDTVLATIRFANGAVGTAVIGDFGPSPWTQLGFYGLFDGAGRSATLHHFSEGLCLGTAGSEVIPFEPPSEPAQNLSVSDLSDKERDDPYGYAGTMAEFIDCARQNRPPAIAATVRDGRIATETILACFESIRTGAPITLSEPTP
jgi:myo-inositol 2-dehydrogenase / D-chiro-inositol 1-dehydrogenase